MAETTEGNEPVHLNNHHIDTLSSIFAHPTGHNIQSTSSRSPKQWGPSTKARRQVPRHHRRRGRSVHQATSQGHRPRQVMDRRLKLAGYAPQQPGKEV